MDFVSNLAVWFLIALLYSCVGWFYEFLYDIFVHHKIVNRGFLIGPICPIYGIGAIVITLLIRNVDNIIAIFLLSIFFSAILEYFTSYFMEKIFRVRWWDYSHEFCNLHGRICLKALIFFGIMGVVILKVTNPLIFGFLDKLNPNVIVITAIILLAILLADIATSLWLIIKCRVTVGTLRADATDEITARVREILLSKGKLNRRLAKAFPTMKVNNKTRKPKISSQKSKSKTVRKTKTSKSSKSKL